MLTEEPRKCRHCGDPLPKQARTTNPMEFCKGACRAMARVKQRRDNAKDAVDLLERTAFEAESLAAGLLGSESRMRLIVSVIANVQDEAVKMASDFLLSEAVADYQNAAILTDFARRNRMLATVVANLVDKPREKVKGGDLIDAVSS